MKKSYLTLIILQENRTVIVVIVIMVRAGISHTSLTLARIVGLLTTFFSRSLSKVLSALAAGDTSEGVAASIILESLLRHTFV